MVVPVLLEGEWRSRVLSRDERGSIHLSLSIPGGTPASVGVRDEDGTAITLTRLPDSASALTTAKLSPGDYGVYAEAGAGITAFPPGSTATLSLEIQHPTDGSHNYLVRGIPISGLSQARLVMLQVDNERVLSLVPAEGQEVDDVGGWLVNRRREGGEDTSITVSTFYVDTSASMMRRAQEVEFLHKLVESYCKALKCATPPWELLDVGGVQEAGVGAPTVPQASDGSRPLLITDLPSSGNDTDTLVLGDPQVMGYFGHATSTFCFESAEMEEIDGEVSQEAAEKLMELARWLCRRGNE